MLTFVGSSPVQTVVISFYSKNADFPEFLSDCQCSKLTIIVNSKELDN